MAIKLIKKILCIILFLQLNKTHDIVTANFSLKVTEKIMVNNAETSKCEKPQMSKYGHGPTLHTLMHEKLSKCSNCKKMPWS
jgi:hypothetical protein